MSSISVTELFAFPSSTFIENIIVRPNVKVLFTSTSINKLFELDPTDAELHPRSVAKIPAATSLTGIVEISHNTYIVSGGIMRTPFTFEEGSMHLHAISFGRQTQPNEDQGPLVTRVANVRGTRMMNGMAAAVIGSEEIILSADSILGRIIRVNIRTGYVDVAFSDDLLVNPNRTDRVPCGVNGIGVYNNQLYFVNSALRIFGRIPLMKMATV